MFDPYTGEDLGTGRLKQRSPGARAGLETPRYCGACGRRMVVRITPMGWAATCSRHGEVSG